MKIKNLVVVLALIPITTFAADFEKIYQSIYLGQAYPSGSVYVVPFVGNERTDFTYPGSLGFFRVVYSEGDENIIERGRYIRRLTGDNKTAPYIHDYIPGLEGLSATYDCGDEKKYRLIKKYRYLHNSDFFSLTSGGCYDFKTIGNYRFRARDEFSYSILAFTNNINFENIRLYPVYPKETRRPVSDKDKKELDQELMKYAEWEKQGECTTINRTIADANIYMQADMKNTSYKIRLSSFPDPGCFGHFVINYIIDILDKDNKVLESRSILAVQGVL